jgi:serine/threonine-protein kinase
MGKAREMGSYELVELIGRGGMGEVWKAKHRMLARKAAIKLIRAEALCCTSEQEIAAARRRFEREAQATAALHSPNTVALYDYGVTDDGIFYYVMELLDGSDLETFVERFGPQPAPRVIYLLRQICASLAEAHSCGLTHRDIKPKNIHLCRLGLSFDFVKVLDFGLVKSRESTGDQTRLTREGVTTGTPAFMSPEMALGKGNVDARTDIYALGCVAYWLLTGKLVFEASTALAMALEHIRTEPIPPSERTEIEIPDQLERIVLDCLRKDPAQRPQTARELGRMLAACSGANAWDNDRAEEWWRMHLPGKALCGPTVNVEEDDTVTAGAAVSN